MAKNFELAIKVEEKNKAAISQEQAGNAARAIQLYEQNIRENYADEFAFDRLMILYRKQKQYKDELRVINRGVEIFEQHMHDHVKHSLSRRVDAGKLERLSNAIMKSSGLKKNRQHFPDPIDRWLKRKEVVKKKLKQ